MQSLQRAIRRDQAIVCFDPVTKKPYIVRKKGTGKKEWEKQRRFFRSFEYEEGILSNNTAVAEN